tara:strand:+ start:96 stop:584 length:489 start_codon:yes stop_codon:yes gene_type:complete
MIFHWNLEIVLEYLGYMRELMTNVLIIHGLGMERRGIEQIDVFGTMKIDDYNEAITKFADELEVSIEIFHSNDESEVISKLLESESFFDGVLINPAGYTKGFPQLADCISSSKVPCVEIHFSNPAKRGRDSDIAPVCVGVITGAGVYGYYLGLMALKNLPNV